MCKFDFKFFCKPVTRNPISHLMTNSCTRVTLLKQRFFYLHLICYYEINNTNMTYNNIYICNCVSALRPKNCLIFSGIFSVILPFPAFLILFMEFSFTNNIHFLLLMLLLVYPHQMDTPMRQLKNLYICEGCVFFPSFSLNSKQELCRSR